jgi:hypothetical protein
MPEILPPDLTPEDLQAIHVTCRDYIEGWYNADAERMRGSLHPDLVKRTLQHDLRREAWSLRQSTGAERLVELTRAGGGSDLPVSDSTYSIDILHAFRHIAVAAVLSHDFMDYLLLACLDGRWLIVDALWELLAGEIEV